MTAGEYVMVSIEDGGSGMPADVVARVFEPFYTTKELGKGTGLGLSMVYGFVKQSGGHVKIYSEVGIGTAVKLYLPRVAGEAGVARGAAARSDSLPTGDETVLLVEDDPMVRANTKAQLDMLGYRVTTAENAAEALAIVSDEFLPDLVLTDIYSAGEDPIDGVTLETLAAAIRRSVHGTVDVVPRVEDVVPALVLAARPGDVVLTLGAGSIGAVPDRLVDALQKMEQAGKPGATGKPKGAGA